MYIYIYIKYCGHIYKYIQMKKSVENTTYITVKKHHRIDLNRLYGVFISTVVYLYTQ